MQDVIREFVVSLRGQVDRAGFTEMERAVDSASASIIDFANIAAGALAGSALAMAVRATADRFNDLGDIAERVGGVTAAQLDRLGYIAELSGSDAATAQASFESLSKTIGEAASGAGRGAQLFKELGISAKNVDGSVRSVESVMGDLGKKLDGLSNAEQQAMIQRLGLDRSMVGVLTADTKAIGEEYDERTKLLGLNADEAAEVSGAFNDSIFRMSRAAQDVFSAFVVRILPALTDAFETVAAWVTRSAQSLRRFLDPIASGFNVLVILVKNAGRVLATLARAFSPLILGIGGVALAIKALNAIWAASPLGKAVAAVAAVSAAIGLLIDDFEAFRDGGESFFTFWGPIVKIVDSCTAAFDRFDKRMTESGAWDSLAKAAQAVFGTIGGAIQSLYALVKSVTALILGCFTGNAEEIEKSWTEFVDSLQKTIESFGTIFTGIFDGIARYFGTTLTKMTDAVKDWVTSKLKGAFGKVADFFGFGDEAPASADGKTGAAGTSAALATNVPPQAAIPSTVSNTASTVNNNSRTINQQITVRSDGAARALARDAYDMPYGQGVDK